MNYSQNLTPEIITATNTQDGKGFYVKYRKGKQEYIAYEPYTEELYKILIPYLRLA